MVNNLKIFLYVLLIAAVAIIFTVLLIFRQAANSFFQQGNEYTKSIALSIVNAQIARETAEEILNKEMLGQAYLLSLLVSKGVTKGELVEVANKSSIDEFWVTDEKGKTILTNFDEGIHFSFSSDPESQAYEFLHLLDGSVMEIVQKAQARTVDPTLFKYVGVQGWGKPAIVQIGRNGTMLLQLEKEIGQEAIMESIKATLAERVIVTAIISKDYEIISTSDEKLSLIPYTSILKKEKNDFDAAERNFTYFDEEISFYTAPILGDSILLVGLSNEPLKKIKWMTTLIATVSILIIFVFLPLVIRSQLREEQKVKQQLVEARDKALQASKVKSEFLASMSHEIRTPINAIIGMADLLADSKLNVEQKKYVNIFQRAGENLSTLINSILDLSKIESGQVSLQKEPFMIRKLLESVVDIFIFQAGKKNINLTTEVDPRIPSLIVGDETKLRQVLINLIGNAVKFTENGKVNITIKLREDGMLSFSVTDTGIGIEKKNLSKIFEEFIQEDMTTTKAYGGTGLGLAISKKLVHLMGGEISVESEKDQGSTFTFTVTMEETTSSLISSKVNIAATNLFDEKVQNSPILIVEDSPDNMLLIERYLQKANIPYETAVNGEEAVIKFKEGKYSIILMDMQMPIKDGYTAVREIRKFELDNNLNRTPIIALTAYALLEDYDKTKAAGCDYHLTKPIRKEVLLNTLKQFS